MTITDDVPTTRVDVLAPVPDEIEAFDLPVEGALPAELAGRYLRNGPNPRPGERPGHWFTGHGMLHGVELRDGRAGWYRNRWVRTDRLAGHPSVIPTGPGRPPRIDLAANPANTHVIEHGGVLLALCEAGLPYRVTGDLETDGTYDFDGRLRTAMTAHPKTDPVTGELFFFGYSAFAPYLTFHVADPTGRLVLSRPVEVAGPTMMHDFAITEHYVIWLDLPVVFDRTGLERGMPYSWSDDYGARLGIMPRTGGPVRWVEIDPCYVFHVGNASERTGADGRTRIVLDAVRYTPAAFASAWGAIGPSRHPDPVRRATETVTRAGVSVLHRWSVDPVAGTVVETPLDDREVEFPSLDDARVGRTNRYLYAVGNSGPSRIVRFDTERRSTESIELGATRVGEAVFVPAAGRGGGVDAQEDAGWLLSIVTPYDGSASELLVLDASAVAAGPVARVRLPRRVPAGFHGSWIPDQEVG